MNRARSTSAMDGVARLRAFAKARGLRTTRQQLMVADVPETLARHMTLTWGERRIRLAASANWLYAHFGLETDIVFAVGAPSRLVGGRWIRHAPAPAPAPEREHEAKAPPDAALFVLDAETNADAATSQRTLAWLAAPAHLALIDALALTAGEALRVDYGNCSLIAHASRVPDDRLIDGPIDQPIDWLMDRLMALVDALPVDRARRPALASPLDLDPLPPALRDIVAEFLPLAEADDQLRAEATRALSKATRRRFLAAMTPLLPAIDTYLDSLEEPYPEAACALMTLAELASELR